MSVIPALPTVPIVHEGAPADPPVVNGHLFQPFKDGLYLAEMPEEDAQVFLRVSGYRQFGGDLTDRIVAGEESIADPAGEGAGEAEGQEVPPPVETREMTESEKESALPTDEQIDEMTKVEAIAFAKEHYEMELSGKADDVRADLKAIVAHLREQLDGAQIEAAPAGEGAGDGAGEAEGQEA